MVFVHFHGIITWTPWRSHVTQMLVCALGLLRFVPVTTRVAHKFATDRAYRSFGAVFESLRYEGEFGPQIARGVTEFLSLLDVQHTTIAFNSLQDEEGEARRRRLLEEGLQRPPPLRRRRGQPAGHGLHLFEVLVFLLSSSYYAMNGIVAKMHQRCREPRGCPLSRPPRRGPRRRPRKARAMETKCALAAEARQACTTGQFDASLAALATLRGGLRDAADIAWVKENEAAVRARAAACPGRDPARPEFFPRIANMKWRVDVSISTSSLDKIMKPSVMVELSLSDGSIKTFEMDVDQFQKLRYDTARLLRQMQEIERHPIMRIVD